MALATAPLNALPSSISASSTGTGTDTPFSPGLGGVLVHTPPLIDPIGGSDLDGAGFDGVLGAGDALPPSMFCGTGTLGCPFFGGLLVHTPP